MGREWTDKRMDDFTKGVDQRFDQVAKRFDQVDERFDRFERSVDARFDKLDARFDTADAVERARFAAVHADLATVVEKMDKMNRGVMTGLISVVAAVAIKVFGG